MNPVQVYESLIDVVQSTILQGDGNSQTNTRILQLNPVQSGGSNSGVTPSVRCEGMAVPYFRLTNRAAGSAYVGIGVRIPNRFWTAGQWVDATTTYTDDVTDAQDVGTSDFVLETTTNSDGYMIASDVLFNAVLVDIGTASAGAGDPVRAARYSDSAGTGWSALTTLVLTGAAADYSTSTETVVAFQTPSDWGLHVSGLGTGTPVGKYLLNVRATTAPVTTAGIANSITLYRIYFLESVAADASLELNVSPAEFGMPHGDGLVAFFATADAENSVRALARYRG